jgi:hypothetical protein
MDIDLAVEQHDRNVNGVKNMIIPAGKINSSKTRLKKKAKVKQHYTREIEY